MLIPTAIGILFLLVAATAAWPTIRFAARATRAEGVYVGAVAFHDGKQGGRFLRPMIRYQTPDGSVRTFTARSGSTGPAYADGQRVAILYDSADPGDARLASFTELWVGPAVLAACGLFLTALGASLYVALGRQAEGIRRAVG